MKFGTFLLIFGWITFASMQFHVAACKSLPVSNKTKLMDMNVDTHMEIVEGLGFDDLMKMASTSKYFENIVGNVFKRKYSHKPIQIGVPFRKTKKISNTLIISNMKLAGDVLIKFGNLVTNLLIDYRQIKPKQSRKLNEQVNKYCSESLTTLHFNGFTSDPLADMSNSFPNVEEVSFVGEAARIGTESASINKIFPKLQKLYLNVANVEHQNCVNQQYQHLDHLHIVFSAPVAKFIGFNESTIEKMLRKNPQILSISIDFASLSFLKKVSDILPNLHTLSFDSIAEYSNYNKDIRFKNVRKLSLQATSDTVPSRVSFDKVEEVEFESFRAIGNQWIEYFGRFPTIKKLSVIKSGRIRADGLALLSEKLRNLEEVMLIVDSNISKANIVDFVKRCANLKKFHLMVVWKDQFKGIDEEFGNLFKVKTSREENWAAVIIERVGDD